MKKKILLGIAVLFLIAVLFSLSLVIFAAEDTSSNTAPSSAVWQITHKDGSVEYSDTFKGGFSSIADGDTFKLLPATYNVYLADYANVRPTSKVNITIDLRGTTIIAPETGDVDGQIFNVSDSNKGSTVNVLMENAVIYAAPGGRCAFSVGGYTVINIDGGKDGGKIYAGGALNLTANYSDESTYSTIKNMYCYKSTPNMAGMICSRNTSKLKLIDTYAVGGAECGSTSLLYVRNSGCMILENSHGFSLTDKNNVLEFVEATDETSFTLGRGSTLYGNVKGLTSPSLMKIAPGAKLGAYYSATLLGDSYVSDEPSEITYTAYTSSEVGKENVGQVTFTYPYLVRENVVIGDSWETDSVWKLEGGGAVKYATSISALNLSDEAFDKVTLLCDIEISEANVIDLKGDLEIDFAGKSVKLKSGADVGFAFIVNGTGNLTLSLGASEVNLVGASFLRANNTGSVTVSASGMIAADTVVSKTKSDSILSLEGGAYFASLGNVITSESALELKNLSFTSNESGTLVLSPENIKANSCTLIAKDDAEAVRTEKTFTLVAENYIKGKVTATDIAVGDYSYFTQKPVCVSISTPLFVENAAKQLNILDVSDGALSKSKLTVVFTYYTREYTLSDTKKDNSVWKLEDKNGTVKYTDHTHTPFIDLSQFVNYTLLCDLNLTGNFSLSLAGDIKIDLGSNKVSLASGYNKENAVFDVSGDGVITIASSGAVVDAGGTLFVRADKIRGVVLSLENSFVNADTAVSATGTPITASGGYYSVKKSAFAVSGADVTLTALGAYSNTGSTLVDSTGDVTVNAGVELVALNKSKAISTSSKLMVADGINIAGNTVAKEFYSAGTVNFTLQPSFAYSNMLLVQKKESRDFIVKTMTNGKISETKANLATAYTTVNIDDGLKVSMHLASSATLNVYVPTAIVNSDPSFKVRIVLDGLLYEADASDGSAKTVDGIAYVKFSYSYVYPNSYDKEAKITLLSGGFSSDERISISDYLSRTMDMSESDELRAVIASYAAYSAECSGVKLPADSPISQYAKKLTVYKEKDAESLFTYFRSVRYEPSANELRFTPWTSCDYTVDIAYKFGETDMAYTFVSKDGAFAIPVYRFVMSSDFAMTFTDSSGAKTLNINLYDLADFAEAGSDTRMLLTLYLAYANALAECLG